MNRRNFLITAGIVAVPVAVLAQPSQKINPDEGVTAPEDLMKEHGVLDRCLLIYEEGMRRLRSGEPIEAGVFNRTAKIIKKFVEDYHEKNEETFIFPRFEKAGKLTDLVQTLRKQHEAGRAVTARIIELSQGGNLPENRDKIIDGCSKFIRMYRPHAAREDTVLFPALRTILSPRQVLEIGGRMENSEIKVLGDEGFEKTVDQVAAIEKELGIHDLTRFTP